MTAATDPAHAIATALQVLPPGCSWAAVRHVREQAAHLAVRNEQPLHNGSALDEGAMCEVLVDGQLGYAATADTSVPGLRAALQRAAATTRAAAAHRLHAFGSDQRPPARGGYLSPHAEPLAAADAARVQQLLLAASAAMRSDDARLVTRNAHAALVQTRQRYLSTNGTDLDQHWQFVDIGLAATAAEGLQSQTRSWSRTGQWGAEALDLAQAELEARRIAREALLLLQAPDCPTGRLDLLLMPDQMMLQIHESIGHPLELDRILGDERNYAGWSFVRPEDFGSLRYGSPLMNVCFDPGRAHGFASYAYDDAGNPARRERLIENGILRRGLGSLESQARSGLPGVANFRATSWNRAPIDRMANIDLEPGTATLDELIAQVDDGILMATNRSWSIDDYRNKFQFGCEWGQRIERGRLTGVVRNPNYRGVTVDFWNRLAGVGRDDAAYGTPYCGKGEPNQIIRVGHAAPPCLFRGVEVFGGGA
ncbi:TldD/PmbA family protein [Pseudorhodoferax sp.]|uniref:TldD/PmbA family protein n=1 Tax=Pseudorhodoferax sp. TaxID=1993553 RepID=UPI002DD689C7|nr:metallopeptidase TldD-related protein [Pseudorhodoferax sp.]